MKKTILSFVIIAVFVINVNFVFAENNPGKKFGRGVVNVVTAPLEIPKQTRAYWIEGSEKTPHILVWLFAGAVKGVVETVKRTGSGVWDMATFVFEKPDAYEPLMKPDYVFDDWPGRK